MFIRLFGEVIENYDAHVPARIEAYELEPTYSALSEIFLALQVHRGHENFVRSDHLHSCDLFIPGINTVVEFDEPQHFTKARKVALSLYPKVLPLGFDLEEWVRRCDAIDAKDNDPVFRDEQRAWYDSLRDFLPLTTGKNSTIRIFMGEFPWCSLDPKNPADVLKFRKRIEGTSSKESPSEDSSLSVASVVIQCRNQGTNENQLLLMREIVRKVGSEADIILFPAGFFVSQNDHEAETEAIARKVQDLLKGSASQSTICFGFDSPKTGKSKLPTHQLAVSVDSTGLIGLARKFYPTEAERGQIQLALDPFSSEQGSPRIIEIKGKRIFLAVCYDSFGIKKQALKNPEIDLVLNLVHGFYPQGEVGSGEVYFAKHGMAGASKQWNCPAIGSATYFNRHIPENWPSGVLWNQGHKSTQTWKYTNNPLRPTKEHRITLDGTNASLRLFRI